MTQPGVEQGPTIAVPLIQAIEESSGHSQDNTVAVAHGFDDAVALRQGRPTDQHLPIAGGQCVKRLVARHRAGHAHADGLRGAGPGRKAVRGNVVFVKITRAVAAQGKQAIADRAKHTPSAAYTRPARQGCARRPDRTQRRVGRAADVDVAARIRRARNRRRANHRRACPIHLHAIRREAMHHNTINLGAQGRGQVAAHARARQHNAILRVANRQAAEAHTGCVDHARAKCAAVAIHKHQVGVYADDA